MDIKISPISFQSKIKLILPEQFYQKIKLLPTDLHEVDYPWNPDTMKFGKNLFTRGIMDCVVGGIKDNDNIKLFHQGDWTAELAKRYSQKEFDAAKFEEKLLQNINLSNKNLHALIFGGFHSRHNKANSLLDVILKIFKKNNIPYTEITKRKNVHYFGKFSLLYENDSDTWIMTNSLFDAKDLRGRNLEMEMLNGKIHYNTYGTPQQHYKVTRHSGSIEDYLNSQFEEVRLCQYDTFA